VVRIASHLSTAVEELREDLAQAEAQSAATNRTRTLFDLIYSSVDFDDAKAPGRGVGRG